MLNGLLTIEKIGDHVKSVFVDQEVLECARLNKRTNARISKQKKEHAAKLHRKKCMRKTANRILAEACFGGAVAWAGSAGLIAPVIWIPVSIISVCVACMRLGMWFGRGETK